MTSPAPKASIKDVKDFFETDGRVLPNSELLAFKKTDPAGYDQVARGIADGTFTYSST